MVGLLMSARINSLCRLYMFCYSSDDMVERIPAPASAGNITLNIWFPNDAWCSLIFKTQGLSTARTIRNDKTISRPSSRH
jgi:hypothetical protein